MGQSEHERETRPVAALSGVAPLLLETRRVAAVDVVAAESAALTLHALRAPPPPMTEATPQLPTVVPLSDVPTHVGAFTITGVLGRGGMARVYRAQHPALGEVALKVLHRDVATFINAERFEREALAARAAAHANVVEVYAAGVDDGDRWIASELVDGGTVHELWKKMGVLPPLLAVKIVAGALDGLAAAHAHHITHRDLKAANLLLTRDGVVKLADFGVAKDHGATTLTSLGLVFGTPSNMSPEQARGERVDGRSDLFAVGTLFHELLTGVNPFARHNATASLLAVDAARAPPLPASVPNTLRDIVEKLLQRDPELRFQSVHELRAALKPLVRLADRVWPHLVKDALYAPLEVQAELLSGRRLDEATRRPPQTLPPPARAPSKKLKPTPAKTTTKRPPAWSVAVAVAVVVGFVAGRAGAPSSVSSVSSPTATQTALSSTQTASLQQSRLAEQEHLYALGRYGDAVRFADLVEGVDVTSSWAARALLVKAKAHQAKGDLVAARGSFAAVVRHPAAASDVRAEARRLHVLLAQ